MTLITGTELITFVDDPTAQGKTRSEICREFYTELHEAKGGPEVLNNKEEDDEYNHTHPEVDEEYMQKYNDLCEQYSQQAVDFFLTFRSDCDLEDFSKYYVGYFESRSEFAEEWYESLDIPVEIVVNWGATWDVNLSSDFTYLSGYVFRNSI